MSSDRNSVSWKLRVARGISRRASRSIMQGLCLVVDAEPSVPGLGHQPRELRLVHVDECRVIPGFRYTSGCAWMLSSMITSNS